MEISQDFAEPGIVLSDAEVEARGRKRSVRIVDSKALRILWGSNVSGSQEVLLRKVYASWALA